jgi:PII-like signaling protein
MDEFDEKNKLKSFSFCRNRQKLPTMESFFQIKQKIKESGDKLMERKKSLTLLERVKVSCSPFKNVIKDRENED